MRRNKRIRSRRRNIITLVILLMSLFLVDNMMLSFAEYLPMRVEEYPEAKTLHIGWIEEEACAPLEQYLNSAPGVRSYIKDYVLVRTSLLEVEWGSSLSTVGCDYETVKEYILTEN